MFKTIIKKILLLPRVKTCVKKTVWQILKFYRSRAEKEEYLLDALDIRECFDEEAGATLENIARMIETRDMQIVEIGSWKGFSTYFLAKVALKNNGKVFAVDHWMGGGIGPS